MASCLTITSLTHILQKFQFNKYWLQRDCTLEGIQYECLYTLLFSISLSDHNDLAHDRKLQTKSFSLFLFHWHTIKGSQCKKNKRHLLMSFWLMRNSGDKWDGASWMWCGIVIVDIARRQVCPCRLRLALAGTWPWSWQSRVRKPQPWGHNNRPSTRCRATARKRSWFYRLWG